MASSYANLVLQAFEGSLPKHSEMVNRAVHRTLILTWLACVRHKRNVRKGMPADVAGRVKEFLGDALDEELPTAAMMKCISDTSLQQHKRKLKCIVDSYLRQLLHERVIPAARTGENTARLRIPDTVLTEVGNFVARVRDHQTAEQVIRTALTKLGYTATIERAGYNGFERYISVSW
eukprot:TRINITY_DN46736_c0_g1_i1.p1 TRINITY_DN46736_c0_g1~~TRINITY_DN46736_c0_g1_i1.p1  ORF type:complete len:199 (+),score=33.00 TRINITY_DN46736_c0_g1_i1:67-597(+)